MLQEKETITLSIFDAYELQQWSAWQDFYKDAILGNGSFHMLAVMKSCLIWNKVHSIWEEKHAWYCKSSQVLGGSESMYLKREPGTFSLLDQHPSWKSHFTADRDHYRKPQPVIIQISTDNGMSSSNRYIYSSTSVPPTQGTSKVMGGKTLKLEYEAIYYETVPLLSDREAPPLMPQQ